jgi:hypothetical protein
MKLFVSYTMRDGYITPSVLRIVERIFKDEGHSVFIDYLNNDSEKKQERVIKELKESDQVILLITPLVRKSQWVNRELICARQHHIKVVPYKFINNVLMQQYYA